MPHPHTSARRNATSMCSCISEDSSGGAQQWQRGTTEAAEHTGGGAQLWAELPPSLTARHVLALLQPFEVASAASACKAWRGSIAAAIAKLSPKSIEGLAFIARCCPNLQVLDLSHAAPARDSGGDAGAGFGSAVRALTALTSLSAATSDSLIFFGRAVCLASHDLQHLVCLTELRALDLSGQPALRHRPGLGAWLPRLSALRVLRLGGGVELSPAGWRAVAALPSLVGLDLHGAADVGALPLPELFFGGGGDGGGGGGGIGAGGLTALAALDLSHAHGELSPQGAAAIARLPALRSLSLAGSSGVATDALLACLGGATPVALAELNLAGCSALTDAGLAHLSSLPSLTSLDLSYCSHNVTGAGLVGLMRLRSLVLRGCAELSYDAVWRLLRSSDASGHSLRRLCLAVATLHAHERPAAPLPASLVLGSGYEPQPLPDADAAPVGADAGDAATPADTSTTSNKRGLEFLELSGAQVQWRDAGAGHMRPSHSANLLLDLVCAPGLLGGGGLTALRWAHCEAPADARVLRVLRRQPRLAELVLERGWCRDAAGAWAGLHLNSALTRLELGGFRASGTANGTQHLLQAAASLPQLRSLGLSSWSFDFATLHPLAHLASSLTRLDLSSPRDMSERALWSLTRFTNLVELSLDFAPAAASDQAWALIFTPLTRVEQLSLRGARCFTSRSVPALLHLRRLRTLDISGCPAVAGDALEKLSELRALAALYVDEAHVTPTMLRALGACLSLRHLKVTPGHGALSADALLPWVLVR